MNIRVFELAKARNLTIGQVVDILARKGVPDATAITYVAPDILDDVQDLPMAAPATPDAPGTGQDTAAAHDALSRQRSSAIAANIARKGAMAESPWQDRTPERDNPLVIVSLGLSVFALVVAGFLFFSERSDRLELKELAAELNLVKAGNAKVEDIVVNNRAQILDLKDEMGDLKKRLYEFRRTSLLTQLKSQGVVIRALSESMKEPLKSKAQTLSNHLSTF